MDSEKKRDGSHMEVVKLIGWILFLFSFLIMLLDYKDGQVTGLFWIGCAMTPIGIVCLMIAKKRQKRQIAPSSEKGNPLSADKKEEERKAI